MQLISSRTFTKTKRFHIAGIGVFRIKSVERAETPTGRYVVINGVAVCETLSMTKQLLRFGEYRQVALPILNDLIGVFPSGTGLTQQLSKKQFVEFVNNHG